MRIAVIGTGYVGLVSGTCFAELGFNVTCVDKDEKKIAALKAGVIPIYEPGLEPLVATNARVGRLSFTTHLREAMHKADVVMLAVGTPTRNNSGEADLRYIFEAAEEIGAALTHPTLIITKSTVPVGTGRQIAATIKKTNPGAVFDIASNPEFLREGFAIHDFMQPDRIVAGCDSAHAKRTITALYQPLIAQHNTPLLFTSLETSEMIKYASNSFLAAKLSFINEMSDLCEKLGADIQDVTKGMGLDTRIGNKFLNPGPGFGGSCFPKDTLALIKTAEDVGIDARIMRMIVAANEDRKRQMAARIITACGGNVKGKTIAIWGLTFKPDTDDMRNSPSLTILPELLKAGAALRVYDPQGMEEAKHLLEGNITWCKDAYDAAKGSDALAIITEWDEFKKADLKKVKTCLTNQLIIDLRNIYKVEDMEKLGFNYVSLGRRSGVPDFPAQWDPKLGIHVT